MKWFVARGVAAFMVCLSVGCTPAKTTEEPAEPEGEAEVEGGFEAASVDVPDEAPATKDGREVYALDTVPFYSEMPWGLEDATRRLSGVDTADGVAALIEQVGVCELPVEPKKALPKCPQRDAYLSAWRAREPGQESSKAWLQGALPNLEHPRADARLAAVRVLGVLGSQDQDAVGELVSRVKKEGHPAVRAALIDALAGRSAADQGPRSALLANARHPDPRVRSAVARGLSSAAYAADVPTLTAALELLEKDPDDAVRAVGCSALGKRAGTDERALEFMSRATEHGAEDAALYAACWEGLANAFGMPGLKKPSERAYSIVIERLDHTPRAPGRPPHTVLKRLTMLAALNQLPGFVERMALRELGLAIAADTSCDSSARADAVDMAVAYGAKLDDVQRLQADAFAGVLPTGKGADAFVVKRIEAAKLKLSGGR